MKPNTQVWIRISNVGRPAETIKKRVTIREATLELARWLLDVYMCSRIEIVIARTEEELERSGKRAAGDDMMNDLESLLGGTPDEEETNDSQGIA